MFARHYYSLALFSLADPLDKGNSLSLSHMVLIYPAWLSKFLSVLQGC